MASGVYEAYKKDGTRYYRSNIHYKGKHISLGSFENFSDANLAYQQATDLIDDADATLPDTFRHYPMLSFDKIVVILNYRDNGIYIGTPIYLKPNHFFLYYLSPELELKFDNDDLFFYSSHRILKRGGHLYINDYGMQTNLLSRYGIKNHAVAGVDYQFMNGDPLDFRYENIANINPFYGVSRIDQNGRISYLVKLHIKGNYQIGIYDTDIDAAIAYNKAVDLAHAAGIKKNYSLNYIPSLSSREYADRYTKIRVSRSFRDYLKTLS